MRIRPIIRLRDRDERIRLGGGAMIPAAHFHSLTVPGGIFLACPRAPMEPICHQPNASRSLKIGIPEGVSRLLAVSGGV